MSRQSSLGSALPSPKQSQFTSTPERGSFLNTYRTEFGVKQMSGSPSKDPVLSEAAQPSQASALGDVMCPSKQDEAGELALSDDPLLDPLESGALLGISRLDEAASDSAAGADLALPSAAPDPLSSPLLQVSPEHSFNATSVADPFAQSSPEPVLLSGGEEAWPSAVPQLSTRQSLGDQPDEVHKRQTADEHDSSGEPDADEGINAGLLGTGERGSPIQTVSETLDDIQADQSGGLFGGLEMEDADQLSEHAGENGSTALDKAVGSASTSTAPATDPSSSDSPEATTSCSQNGHNQARSSGFPERVQAAEGKEDAVQPLPISKPVCTTACLPGVTQQCCSLFRRDCWWARTS